MCDRQQIWCNFQSKWLDQSTGNQLYELQFAIPSAMKFGSNAHDIYLKCRNLFKSTKVLKAETCGSADTREVAGMPKKSFRFL